MIAKGLIQCPYCCRPFRAWFQTGLTTVRCPICWVEVDTTDIQLREPAQPASRKGRPLISTVGLIWDRLVGYNTSHPDELAL